jgi:DNA-directed RNA polymerase specialized sigma24 family protein
MDRVGRKLEEGEHVRAADPAVFFYGVARNVLKEYWTDQKKEAAARMLEAPSRFDGDQTPEEREREMRLDCLDRCMEKLPVESRLLIERYYRTEGGARIAARAELATTLGVTPGTLRIRAHRIRRTLEACVNDCMRNKLGSGNGRGSQ